MLSIKEIQAEIEEAFRIFKLLPDSNRHKIVKSCWPEYHRTPQELWSGYGNNEAEMPRFVPTARQISRAEDIFFTWFPLLRDKDQAYAIRLKKVLAMRSMGLPWKLIAYKTGQSRQQCWRDHIAALVNIQLMLQKTEKCYKSHITFVTISG